MENVKKLKLGETGPSFDQKFVSSDNSDQNAWNKVVKLINAVKLDRTRTLWRIF